MAEFAGGTLADVRPRLFGGVDESRISQVGFPRIDPQVLSLLDGQPDVTCIVADALDALGLGGTVPASSLSPLGSGQRIRGQAVTIRWEPYGGDPMTHRRQDSPTLAGDRDLYALAKHGDVAVVAAGGSLDSAVLGELSVGFASKAGIGGIVVDGAIRDAAALRTGPIPVWARGASPLAARYRLATAELNGPVRLSGVPVHPGDLVFADDNGICVVPLARVDDVLAECSRRLAAEARLNAALDQTATLEELVARVRGSSVL